MKNLERYHLQRRTTASGLLRFPEGEVRGKPAREVLCSDRGACVDYTIAKKIIVSVATQH